MKSLPTLALAVSLVLALAAPARAGKPHEHGAAQLDVALDGTTLNLSLESPLDDLVGFERAPRTEAEKRAAAAAIATLRAADALFVIDPAAGCKSTSVELRSAPLGLGAAEATKDDGHGDLDGDFVFQCRSAPAYLDVGLFKAFPRLGRLDVQVAAPKGQRKFALTRTAQRIALPR